MGGRLAGTNENGEEGVEVPARRARLALVACEFPRPGTRHEPVGLGHDLPRCAGCRPKVESLERRVDRRRRLLDPGDELGRGARRRSTVQPVGTRPRDERDRPGDEIAELVRKLVGSPSQQLLAKVDVTRARDVAHAPPAQCVDAVAGHEVERIETRLARLGEPTPAGGHVVVDEDGRG